MDTQTNSKQLDLIITKYKEYVAPTVNKALGKPPMHSARSLVSMSNAAIYRIVGKNSTYYAEVVTILNNGRVIQSQLPSIMGIVKALRSDLENGFTKSAIEIIHADIFSDSLNMSTHLSEKGYKDAAANMKNSKIIK